MQYPIYEREWTPMGTTHALVQSDAGVPAMHLSYWRFITPDTAP